MQNNLQILNQALENNLTAHTAQGFYYQAYFHLLERAGGEAVKSLNRPLEVAELLYLSDWVEKYLKEKVFKE